MSRFRRWRPGPVLFWVVFGADLGEAARARRRQGQAPRLAAHAVIAELPLSFVARAPANAARSLFGLRDPAHPPAQSTNGARGHLLKIEDLRQISMSLHCGRAEQCCAPRPPSRTTGHR
jgi:hypothetical protein